jgi:hypothetical protein
VFELYSNERLADWKRFRDHLESSEHPFQDVADLWSKAPFVNKYLNPDNPSSWPDPWKLILDGTFDDLAISLGMLYTIKLTERFKTADCSIYQTTDLEKKSFLVIDNSTILNWQYRSVDAASSVSGVSAKLVWSKADKV